jgi:hypothetical protein
MRGVPGGIAVNFRSFLEIPCKVKGKKIMGEPIHKDSYLESHYLVKL